MDKYSATESMRGSCGPPRDHAGRGHLTLDDLEQAILDVLDNEFVSTSVLKNRARLKALETMRTLSETVLAASRPVSVMHAVCDGLARRGLAQRAEFSRVVRWRRATLEGATTEPEAWTSGNLSAN